METLTKSSAAEQRIFCPTVQFEKQEIHKVFLCFPNLRLRQNLALTALVDFVIASIGFNFTFFVIIGQPAAREGGGLRFFSERGAIG